MTVSVCTLYEGHYHYGVAALVNSLCVSGFAGNIYVGYRGSLPSWSVSAKDNNTISWNGAKTLSVSDKVIIQFLPLTTDYHLTNYKPDFLLKIWEQVAISTDGMFYFDPDIVITAPWSYFEKWIQCGVALNEDINSPLSENHPKRIAWRNYFNDENTKLVFKTPVYINGGFIGIKKADKSFLTTWKHIQEKMAPAIGGLNRSAFKGVEIPENMKGPFSPFNKTDQDALNVAAEAWEGPVSYIGKHGMGFNTEGYILMPHALGQPKPWRKKFLSLLWQGRIPTLADKAFWQSSSSPIRPYSKFYLTYKMMLIQTASFIGRFYRRN